MNSPPPAGSCKPRLAPGVRLHHDASREQWVLLGPERIVELDAIAHAILVRCDGECSLQTISERLAAEYQAPLAEVLADVSQLCAELADKRLLSL